MKSTKTTSPYSKMYLIPPNMYEKLLSCLDEKGVREAEELNMDKDTQPERPGDKELDMLTKEALQPEIGENLDVNINPEGSDIQPGPQDETNQPEAQAETDWLDVADQEDPEDIPLAEVQRRRWETEKERRRNIRLMKGDISFRNPQGKIFTCDICLKSFTRNWDLTRHKRTVHKNIMHNIPATLNIEESNPNPGMSTDPEFIQNEPYVEEMSQPLPRTPKQTVRPKFIGDEDTEMMVNNPRKSCKLSANTTDRVIPKLFFKPPRSGRMIVPQIKKRMQLITPQINKRVRGTPMKAKNKRPQDDDLMNFEDWTEQKKQGARTSSEAKLIEKPAKWVTDDFEQWKKKKN